MKDNSIEAGSRFLASTLHEVRTPIQTIISTTELLDDTALTKEQAEYVRQIEFSANVLLQLANDVLDFTKISSKEFKLESIPFDIVELTEQIVDLVSINAFAKGLEVITDIDYSMQRNTMGDPTRVQQILLNLVKNAVKFTEKGFIYVKLTHDDKRIFFQVVDSGIGIAQEKQELIFKDFYQVDASITRRYGGTGLGLTISKNLVEAIGGKIGVKSSPKGGSNFWFYIPLVKANLGTDKPIKLSVPKTTKVLIADGNSLAISTFVKKLRSLGIQNIDTAKNGKEVIEKLRTQTKNDSPFTIAFINKQMPHMDGWKIASMIRKDNSISKLKLYLTVPEGLMEKDAKSKMENLFNGYIYKPIKQNQLLSIFNKNEYRANEMERNARKVETKEQESTLVKGYRILIAEDHPVNCKLLTTFLTKYGAEVFIAENGQQAVDQIAAHPEIDIIFMDIFMPVKSGIDATMEIRGTGYNGIIIACTANNDPQDIEQYKKIGINDILIKPYKRDAIKSMLEKWNTVLSLPEAKQIVSIADLNNTEAPLWDLPDFMDTTSGDKQLACSLMKDYITQTQDILDRIKTEFSKDEKDYEQLRNDAHTLKGSSASVSAIELKNIAKSMEEHAIQKDEHNFNSERLNFAMDFIKLKNIVRIWEKSQ